MAKEEEEKRASEEMVRWDRFIPYWNHTKEDFRPVLTGTRAICKFAKKDSFLRARSMN